MMYDVIHVMFVIGVYDVMHDVIHVMYVIGVYDVM